MLERISSDKIFALRSEVRSNYTWERIYKERILPLLEAR
jgi:hypothetical protein